MGKLEYALMQVWVMAFFNCLLFTDDMLIVHDMEDELQTYVYELYELCKHYNFQVMMEQNQNHGKQFTQK